MSAIAYLYKITNTVNNMVYIGVTKNPASRMRSHISNTIPTKSIIKNAIAKYGREKFKLEILVKATQEYCYELEKKAIDAFNTIKPNGYNICSGGVGAIGIFGDKNGMYGKTHSDETKNKIREKKIGQVLSQETKDKMSKAHIGRKHSEESIKKMQNRKFSEESIQKMRDAYKLRSPESIQKQRDAIKNAWAKKLAMKGQS